MKKIFYSMLVAVMTAFSFTSCEDVPAPYDLPNGGGSTPDDNSELKTLYSETFDNNTTAFVFKDVNLTGGLSYVWRVASYNNNGYLNASAFSSNASHASESWAVSPAINLTDSKQAVLSFSHAINKLNDTSTMKDMMTAWVSTDYAGDVTAATWTQVTIPTYPAGTSWSFVESGDIDLTEFCGKNAYIAFKYTSTDDNSGGWEVDNFTVKGDGTPTSTPDNPGTDNPGTDTPTNPTGEGTEANPYSVSAAIAKATATNVYVKGYIVGCVNDKALSSASFDASNFTSQTNVLVAESADETDVTKCMPVQLPAGDVRNGLNLVDNAANYKKAVVLYGNIEKYFGTTGIKTVTYAKVGDTEFGKKPETTTPEQPAGDVLYSETFASGVGTFTIKDVELGGLTYVWTHSTYNNTSYMKGSAYANNAAHASESWLVSASIDLTKASNATLTFEQAINKINDGKVADCCAVLVSSNYSGDVAAATWETLSVDNVPAGTDWNFVTSTASLKSFVGKKVTIAFRYKSTTTVAPTWEVRNVVVK